MRRSITTIMLMLVAMHVRLGAAQIPLPEVSARAAARSTANSSRSAPPVWAPPVRSAGNLPAGGPRSAGWPAPDERFRAGGVSPRAAQGAGAAVALQGVEMPGHARGGATEPVRQAAHFEAVGGSAGAAPKGGASGSEQSKVPLSGRQTQPSMRLPRHGESSLPPGGKPAAGLGSLVTVGGSLAVVLGLFLMVAWLLTPLPSEVVEVLGRAPLAGRQQLHLLRCGRKLLLVSVTPAGAETLTEISEPEEVDRLAGLCQQARPGSATQAFRQVFEQFTGRYAGDSEAEAEFARGYQAGRDSAALDSSGEQIHG